MIKLVLVRHGQSMWNLENKFTGWTDVELSEKGVELEKEAQKGAIVTTEIELLMKMCPSKIIGVTGSDENVHKECVKVYRNVQAAVVEENEKQTEAIAGKIKESLNGKLNGVLGVSIAALLVAAADIVLHVLSILHIF